MKFDKITELLKLMTYENLVKLSNYRKRLVN